MLKGFVKDIVEKIKNPILDLPYYEQKTIDNQLTYSNYSRLKYLLYFMSAFSLLLFSFDFIYFNEWSENNLVYLFFVADSILILSCLVGLFIIHKNKVPSIHFQKRTLHAYLILGAVWTGFLSGQDFEQNAITLVSGVFILTGAFLMKGKFHFLILLSLYATYILMHFWHTSKNHDALTDYAIIPGTMIIAWIYGKIMYKNKIENIQQSLKLQSYSKELKEIVEKRTLELKTKNESLIKEINNKEYIQNQLIASEELFKNILFQSPDSIGIFKIGGEIVQWNSKAEDYSGYKSEKVLGVNIWKLFAKISVDQENKQSLKSKVEEFTNKIIENPTSTTVLNIRHWVTNKNEPKRYLESKIFPIHLQDKTLIAIVSRNITSQLVNEQKLKAAIDHAEEANNAKSDFLANISHDLRSPLNSISGFSQILKLKPDLKKEKQTKYLDIIYDNGQYLLQLINSLIDLSKLQSGNISIDNTKFNIDEFMQEITSIIESEKTLYAPNIKLENNCNLSDISIISDRTKLLQIFTNLLSNAVKFTKKGAVSYGCNIEDDVLFGYVSDTGIGMNKGQKNQIFDRFYSLQDDHNTRRKGKGLGLAIVKGYIELLKGDIKVESALGEGTTFKFSIPIKVARIKKKNASSIKPPANKTIMVYDTNSESMEFTNELLNAYSLKVKKLKKIADLEGSIDEFKPDLLLIDIEPEYGIYKKHLTLLKSKYPDLPVLAYTALPQTELPNDLSLMFDVIIFKPINANILIQKITNHL